MNLQKASAPPPSTPVLHRPDMREITPDELKLHFTKSDCWIALRGHVYDITDYIKFHPGGVEQIMKGAGKEATAMFNAIHRYVNFETILKGKQVGIYTRLPAETDTLEYTLSHRDIVGTENMGGKAKCWGCKICNYCLADENTTQLIPATEFTESDKYVYLKVNSRGLRRNKDYWTVGILNREELLLKLITKPPDMWIAHFKLTNPLEDDTIAVSFSNRCKNMMLRLKKPQSLQWKVLGTPLIEHNEIEDSRSILEDMHQGTIRVNEEVATNLYFMAIQMPPSVVIGIPVGFDVKVRVDGTARRYTPVTPFFNKKWKNADDAKFQYVYLVYRMYPDGQMTPKLRDLPIDDSTSLKIGCSAGNFDTTWLQGADAYFLLAAGSGITPYFRIIEFVVQHNVALGISHVVLMYWNRVESEIVWKADFEKVEQKHVWFQFIPVLTKPADSWEGMKGRISSTTLQTCMDTIPGLTKDKTRIRFLTCGSDGFNTTVFESVETLGFHSNCLFTFLG